MSRALLLLARGLVLHGVLFAGPRFACGALTFRALLTRLQRFGEPLGLRQGFGAARVRGFVWFCGGECGCDEGGPDTKPQAGGPPRSTAGPPFAASVLLALFFAPFHAFPSSYPQRAVEDGRVVARRRRQAEFGVDDWVDEEREQPSTAGGCRCCPGVVDQ